MTGKLWFVVWVLLVAGNPAKVGAVLLHLISESLLRATELSGDGTVGDALRMILPKRNDGIGLWVKLTQTGKELLQQHAVCDDLVHRLAGIRDIIADGTVAVRERLIQRRCVARSVVLAADAVAVALPYLTVWTHAAPVILLLVADAVGFLIEGVVLRLGDRHLRAGAANVDEIGLLFTLVVILFHNETSKFRVIPEPEAS